jgi:subtilisin family serine protease
MVAKSAFTLNVHRYSEASVADVNAASASADEADHRYRAAAAAMNSTAAAPAAAAPAAAAPAAAVSAAGDDDDDAPRISVQTSIAHGPVDVIMLSSQQPSAEAVTAVGFTLFTLLCSPNTN